MRNDKNNRKKRNAKKRHKKRAIALVVAFAGIGLSALIFNLLEINEKGMDEIKVENTSDSDSDKNLDSNKIVEKEIIITAAGDCTLGTDTNFNRSTDLIAAVASTGNDYSSIMRNVEGIFSEDDYTIVNLENAFTDATVKANKGSGRVFHFKGPKEYAKILKEGKIEGVTIANNHIYDYGAEGFNDTIETLKENEIDFCGEGYNIITEIKGVKFAFLGYQAWTSNQELKNKIEKDINLVKSKGAKVIIPYFHWGIERENKPNADQVDIARFCIDNGADMVLGSHPHVIQSLESYKGKMIVYSLGNFSFGGNSNPNDKRTFMIQMKYKFEEDELTNVEYKVIPAYISSVGYKNDYVPTPVIGEDKDNILKYINEISPTLNSKIEDEFWSIK